jgi:hypothetical protein
MALDAYLLARLPSFRLDMNMLVALVGGGPLLWCAILMPVSLLPGNAFRFVRRLLFSHTW